MLSRNMSCTGCLTVIKGKEYMKCCKCHNVYAPQACKAPQPLRLKSVGQLEHVPSTFAASRREIILVRLFAPKTRLTPRPPQRVALLPIRLLTMSLSVKHNNVDHDIVNLIKTKVQVAVRKELAPIKDQYNHSTDSE